MTLTSVMMAAETPATSGVLITVAMAAVAPASGALAVVGLHVVVG